MTKTKEQIISRINELKVDIWSNPKRPDQVDTDCCEYCGRKCGNNPLYVHVTINGTILPNDISEEDLGLVEMHSQGCWAIGNECAKKLLGDKIDQYTFKY